MKRFIFWLSVLAIVLLVCWMAYNITVFEDGSWAFGNYPYPFSECLPWGLCTQ